MFFAALFLIHTALGEGESLWANPTAFDADNDPWGYNPFSWAQQDCVPIGGGCQFTSDCCISPTRPCLDGQSSDLCMIDQPAAVCQDTRAHGFDEHGNAANFGSANTRKCVARYNYEEEVQCSNDRNWYDAGDRRTAVQKEVPVYCRVREKRILSPGTWPRPEFDCKKGYGVSPSDRIGMKLSFTYEQCHGFFSHADWSFTHDANSNSCWRIKENSMSSRGRNDQTTCHMTRVANPVVGSVDQELRQKEIANGNYIKTTVNTDKCPEGSVVVDDEDRCRAAAKKLGMKFNEVGKDNARSWSTSPKGCLFDTSRGVFLNEEYGSGKHPTQARICEKGGRAPLSWWAAEEPDTDHECAEKCREWWRGDGRCDEGCNVASCNFDDGDCAAPSAPDKFGENCWFFGCDQDAGICHQCGLHNGQQQACCRQGWSSNNPICAGAVYDASKSGTHHCVVVPSGASAGSMAMHAAPTSDVPFAVTAFAAFGFVVTLYGAFKHFTKQ